MKKQGKGNRSGKTEAITNEKLTYCTKRKAMAKKLLKHFCTLSDCLIACILVEEGFHNTTNLDKGAASNKKIS